MTDPDRRRVPRRRILETLGTTVATLVSTGCLTRSGATTDDRQPETDVPTDAQSPTQSSRTPTTTDDSRRVPMGRTVTVGDARFTVNDPRVRKAVDSSGPAHTRVVAGEGQFVVVDVSVDGDPPAAPTALDLRPSANGDKLADSDPLSALGDGMEASYAFPFPARRHDRAAILHSTRKSRTYWNLPEGVREALALEPEFVVSALGVRTSAGRRVLEMTVANEGERDGLFAARVSLAGFSGGSIVEFPIPVGESRTYTGRPGSILTYLENRDGGTLTVRYPGDEGLASIERAVPGGSTASVNRLHR